MSLASAERRPERPILVDANVDRRPFAGAPYAPSNTVSTTGKFESSLKSFHKASEETPSAPAKAAPTAPRTFTLAQLLAAR